MAVLFIKGSKSNETLDNLTHCPKIKYSIIVTTHLSFYLVLTAVSKLAQSKNKRINIFCSYHNSNYGL
ncbi:hypothetical protein [Clostridium estertheticum]|uniref:hypothetical protein n=1 Tax=Clostridium estertheticum TaxID=238834 RepID=UPI001C0C6310|nr:hypothetical protein [Clostridium estertheticum]MBU3187649.1 hypothetical protein [Clostridium estertheticum]